jgi:hypothetical protein
MRTGVLVPAFIAAGVVGARAVLGKQPRAPYPYEYLSWLVVYGAIGMVPDEDFAQALAWGYLLAMVLAPSFADVLKLTGGLVGNSKPPGTSGSAGTAPTTTHVNVSPHTGQVG